MAGMAGRGTTAATAADVSESNFDAAGNLIVPDAVDSNDNTMSIDTIEAELGVDENGMSRIV